MQEPNFIFCLEVLPDVDETQKTTTLIHLEKLATQHQISSIYKTCDDVEGFEDGLKNLLYNDHDFTNYEIIYLIVKGKNENILIHDYYYSLTEIAEIFEGKLKGKIIHFSNFNVLDLDTEDAQYFIDVTSAKALSGYGAKYTNISSTNLDHQFFKLFYEEENPIEVVKMLFEKHYALCKLLDFRLYY